MPAQNIKLIIEYEGTNFAGWQIQKNQTTIQGEIRSAIKKVTGTEVNLIGAGRTDSGVHARGQVANFEIDHRLEPERYRDAINYYLPKDIRILTSEQADTEFNSRFSATSRRYRYLIDLSNSTLHRKFRWGLKNDLNYDLLQSAAKLIVGEHDFAPFCVLSSRKENNLCRIGFSRWYRFGPLLVYEIRGNRFLHSMVRSLVGSMVNLADQNRDNNRLNLTLDSFQDILQSVADERITFTAPAVGLYLVSVGYQEVTRK